MLEDADGHGLDLARGPAQLGGDARSLPGEGLGDAELVVVVGDPVLQPRAVNTDLLAVPGQVEVKQVPALEEGAGAAREQVILELAPRPRPGTKPIAAGATSNFQANSGAL